jgi:hypothetical protein
MHLPELRASAGRTEQARNATTGLGDWLCSGEPQHHSGAFGAWRDASSKQLAFEYPEINGYVLTFVAGLPDPDETSLAAARRAGDWLVERLDSGDYSARAGWDGGAIYTFDLAMIGAGLLSFGRRFDARYEETGHRLVDFLCDEIDAAGSLPAVARGPRPGHTGWATEGRAHLLKAVQCLLAADAGVDSRPGRLADALIREAPGLQQPGGRFSTQSDDVLTMLHPHHYALEGLWIWGTARSEDWALLRARAGLEWAFAQQLASGGFPRFVRTDDGAPGPEQTDVTAQAVRMALVLGEAPAGLERAIDRLISVSAAEDGKVGAPYQPAADARHENVWATLFAAQALGLAGDDGSRPLDWRALV